jgi:hypothetical protein
MILIIKHALRNCTVNMVTDTFNAIVPDSVVSVTDAIHTNKYGYISKSFIIHVIKFEGIQIILNRIQEKGFAAIIYANTWDSTLKCQVDRYWKVYIPNVCKPRLMEEDEQNKIGKVDEIPALEPCSSSFEMNRAMSKTYMDRHARAFFDLTEDLEFLD